MRQNSSVRRASTSFENSSIARRLPAAAGKAVLCTKPLGRNPAEARRMLIEAFLGEVSEKITDNDTRGDIEARMRQWLK